MTFIVDKEELKPGLVIFRRSDVKHRNWYCRVKLPKQDRYKTVSLKTADIHLARERAYDADVDVRFRIKHDVPIFNRPFSQVAEEYVAFQQRRADAGQITKSRVLGARYTLNSHLNAYIGSVQIHLVGRDRWEGYPLWRQSHGTGRRGRAVSGATIRLEMKIFRAIMNFAVTRRYITDAKMFGGKLDLDKPRREAFTPDEYRKLHTHARGWVKRANNQRQSWCRNMVYLFILIMCNTGMRPSEARNLRWRDIETGVDRDGRQLIILHVRGKKKNRSLVAAGSVAEYFDRVRAIAKKSELNDPVFTTYEGNTTKTLYAVMIIGLLTEADLLTGPEGSSRSTYSFRHTYATFRLSEGVDVYILAKQMGTSVQMIEEH